MDGNHITYEVGRFAPLTRGVDGVSAFILLAKGGVLLVSQVRTTAASLQVQFCVLSPLC